MQKILRMSKKRIPIFKDSLLRWNRNTQKKTYNDVKIFMRNEHSELAKVGGLTIGNSMFQGVNLVKEIQELRNHSELMVNNMREEFKQGLQALSVSQNEHQYWNPHNVEDIKDTNNETETYDYMFAVQQN